MLTNLLKGYSEDEIKVKLLHKSHEEMFNDISGMNMEGNISLYAMNELKSYKYDEKIIFEIIAESWDGNPSLDFYETSELNKYSIINAINRLFDEYQASEYRQEGDIDYVQERENKLNDLINTFSSYTEYNDINELIENGSECPINIYYKKNNITKTLDYGDKILDCLK